MLDIKLEQQYIIDLVSYTLFDTPFDFNKYENKKLDYKYIATKIHEQKMEGLVYHAMSMLKINNNLYNHLHNRYMTILYTCVQQENEYQELIKLFEANNIDYVPLKGTFMKHYYPKMEMRLMGDIDVLIPYNKRKDVHDLLIKNGFSNEKDEHISSHHDIYTKGNHCTFEIHYKLLHAIDGNVNYIENIAWTEVENHKFSVEFNIVYLIAHYFVHFSQTGNSYKSILDIVLIISKEKVDKDKLKNFLLKANYYDFFNSIIQLFNYIFKKEVFNFENNLSEEELILINNYIFKCGDFGFGKDNDSDKTKIINDLSKFKRSSFISKIKYIFSQVCIPYSEFKQSSRLIKYCPILLPFGWIARLVKLRISHKGAISSKLRNISSTNDKIIEEQIKLNKTIDKFMNGI